MIVKWIDLEFFFNYDELLEIQEIAREFRKLKVNFNYFKFRRV